MQQFGRDLPISQLGCPVTVRERYPSPLRYPGGKGAVSNYIKLILLESGFLSCEYVEPYAGGASVALSLLYEDYAERIWINDINRSVYAFWSMVLGEPDNLCQRITDTAVTVEEWERQKVVQSDANASPLDLAFSTFFLNRTNRSGIISGGGIIGGKKQTGPWKIDARFNKQELCRRIGKVARFGSRIRVTNLDAADLLRGLSAGSETNAFVYLDPPYYVKGEGLYDNFYQHADHQAISSLVMNLGIPWLVSYDAAPEILDMYQRAASRYYSLRYSARDSRHGSEVMFFSPGVAIPKVPATAGVSFREVTKAHSELFGPVPGSASGVATGSSGNNTPNQDTRVQSACIPTPLPFLGAGAPPA